VRSIAASEVEGLVLGQVRRLLASPELVARIITAVRREDGAAEETEHDEGEVIEALGALQPVWDELYPAEQARILRLLIARIDVAPDGISVTLHAAAIRGLVAELADHEAAALAASEPLLEAAEAIWRTKEMTGAMAMRIFSRGVIVGLFIGLYIGWAF
jgi:site-specific DNA recombinase